ncbi:14771_t:CDS:2 [Funneliformis caledonium]|uniref:14771_t:CDS:1 n=1 Tax=Funneliformis caledonium TaxID=1117310 RepID=A0A9N9IGS8_9GLOM|nr:14771_t:CDS:2 [Funneliformis caledonium]
MAEDPVWESSTVDTINPNVFRQPFNEPDGLFTEINARCMSSKNKNLTSHDDVKDNAEFIYQKLSRMEMPPGRTLDKDGIFEQFRLGPTPSATDYVLSRIFCCLTRFHTIQMGILSGASLADLGNSANCASIPID